MNYRLAVSILLVTQVLAFSVARALPIHNDCHEFYIDNDFTSAQVNKIWSPFKYKRHGIPNSNKKINKPIDDTDIRLLQRSFERLYNGQPIETGIVEILDKNGDVIKTSSFFNGEVGEMLLRNEVEYYLEKAKSYPDAHTIRFRHTHPPGFDRYGRKFLTWKFSEGDIRIGSSLRALMNMDPNLKHLHLVATITYINPSEIDKPTDSNTLKKTARTKAYLLPGKS